MSRARSADDVQVSRIVASNVRRLRQQQNMSPQKLANKIVAQGHSITGHIIMLLEKGVNHNGSLRAFTVDQLVWIAEALGVGPGYLMTKPFCPICNDAPPAGLACRTCGTTA